MTLALHGLGVSRGIAIGRAHVLSASALDVAHYVLPKAEVEAEILRLQSAIQITQQELETLAQNLPTHAPVESAAFIDLHVSLLADPMLCEAPLDLIRHRRYNAEWALTTQLSELSAQFARMEDTYLSERVADVRQVVERVLRKLAQGKTGAKNNLENLAEDTARADFATSAGNSDEAVIIVAHDISPADMLQFKATSFAGFVTDLGAQNSHTAIVARSLALPAVVGTSHASRLCLQNDILIVDGETGVVIADPSPAILAEYRARQAKENDKRTFLQTLKTRATQTQDGTPIKLLANIELANDCAGAIAAGAQGVGLFRSEFLFLNRTDGKLPSEEEQYQAYSEAARAMHGLPVVIRTLDVGADKPLDAKAETALNPALGLRAIRYCLSEPQLFLTQLRALLRASAHGAVEILIPMLAHAHEIRQTLQLLQQAKNELSKQGVTFNPHTKIGAMIEIPAAALTLPLFVKHFDFLSIGTNDLIQYTLAIDRVDHEVADLYEPLHPAVLRLIADTIRIAHEAGKEVAVCGEMAGDVALTPLLLGLGLREFSMHPAQILAVKEAVLNANLSALAAKAQRALLCDEADEVRQVFAALH